MAIFQQNPSTERIYKIAEQNMERSFGRAEGIWVLTVGPVGVQGLVGSRIIAGFFEKR